MIADNNIRGSGIKFFFSFNLNLDQRQCQNDIRQNMMAKPNQPLRSFSGKKKKNNDIKRHYQKPHQRKNNGSI